MTQSARTVPRAPSLCLWALKLTACLPQQLSVVLGVESKAKLSPPTLRRLSLPPETLPATQQQAQVTFYGLPLCLPPHP